MAWQAAEAGLCRSPKAWPGLWPAPRIYSRNSHLGLGPGRSRWAAPCLAGSAAALEVPSSEGTRGHMAPTSGWGLKPPVPRMPSLSPARTHFWPPFPPAAGVQIGKGCHCPGQVCRWPPNHMVTSSSRLPPKQDAEPGNILAQQRGVSGIPWAPKSRACPLRACWVWAPGNPLHVGLIPTFMGLRMVNLTGCKGSPYL